MATLRLLRRIRKVAKWLPILWRDEDWDHAFLWIILRHKLASMRDYHKFYGITEDRTQIALEINSCVEALDRLIDDDYLKDDWAAYEAKYPVEFVKVPGTGCSMMRQRPEDARLEALHLHDREESARQIDSAFVTNTMHKHWFGWWE